VSSSDEILDLLELALVIIEILDTPRDERKVEGADSGCSDDITESDEKGVDRSPQHFLGRIKEKILASVKRLPLKVDTQCVYSERRYAIQAKFTDPVSRKHAIALYRRENADAIVLICVLVYWECLSLWDGEPDGQ